MSEIPHAQRCRYFSACGTLIYPRNIVISPFLQDVDDAGLDADPHLLPYGEGPVAERVVGRRGETAAPHIEEIVGLFAEEGPLYHVPGGDQRRSL